MLYGLYLSTAGAQAQSKRQDVIANNIANADATGFHRQVAIFKKRLEREAEFGAPPPTDPSDPRNLGGGMELAATQTDLATPGVYKQTGQSLDLAIRGEGFFTVNRGGQTLLTRNGTFATDRQGFIVTADGSARLLGVNGGPIRLEGSAPVAVAKDGKITQGEVPVGQVAIVAARNPNLVEHAGGTMFRYRGPTTPARSAVEQGMLEGSNVSPVTEMVSLIEAARAFEMNMSMIQLQNDGLTTLLQTVPRLT